MAAGQQMISAALLGLAEREHALYRFFDAADVLLYVGISVDPILRMKAHRREKDWWSQVRSMTVEPFPTRQAALDAEAEAIRVEKPLHNVQHNEMVAIPAPRGADAGTAACDRDARDLAGEILQHVYDEAGAMADIRRRAARHWGHRYSSDETVNLAVAAMEQAADRYMDLEQSLTSLLHALPFDRGEMEAIEAEAVADLDGFYGPGGWTDVELLSRSAYYARLRLRPVPEEDRRMGDPQGYLMAVKGRTACECGGS